MRAVACSLLLLFAAVASAGPASGSAWRLEAGGETYVFQVAPRPGGGAGVVHVLRGGRKDSEVPIDTAEFDAGHVRLTMSATGVTLVGEVDDAGGITGRLIPPGGGGLDVTLASVDADTIAALAPRFADGRPVTTYAYIEPARLDDGWEVAAPEEVGLDRAALEAMVRAALTGDGGVLHGLLVVKDGRLVLEEYFHGFDRDVPHRLASCTKSVTALLVGLARDEGALPDLDAPLRDFFPDYEGLFTAGREAITVRHVLTMTAGLEWSEATADRAAERDDRFAAALSRPLTSPPGATWAYVSPNVNLLARVLEQATGRSADAFAAERLFAPLGITAWNWEVGRWRGYPRLDGSLRLRPRDAAKIGQLVLDGGRWRDRQIVAEGWIHEATDGRVATSGPERYGYLWWRSSLPSPAGPVEVVFAQGNGGQFISIFPERHIVVIATGGNDDNGRRFAVARLLVDGLFGGRG